VADPGSKRKRIILEGDVPSPLNPPKACRFHPRCPRVETGLCDTQVPGTIDCDGHQVACHVVERELKEAGKAFTVLQSGTTTREDEEN
jgi:ABC-type dipeptide/oligopeptide/nickel transport system ATPase component